MRILRRTAKSLRDIWAEPAGRGLILGAVIVVGIGTSFYRIVEGWSIIDALYFTVVTLTTIGYGDLHPTTDLSKAFTIVFVVAGVGFILGFLNFIVTRTAKDLTKGEDLTKPEE